MKLLIILLAIGTGIYVNNEMDDPSSDLGNTAQQIMSDFQSGFDSGNGNWSGDYESSNAGRPNTMNWAARGGSSVGSAPSPQPRWGRSNDLAAARKAADDAYSRYEWQLRNYGANSSATQQARQEYLNAKYHYDALANNAHQYGR